MWDFLERERGIEPPTNSLGSCDSTTELLPLVWKEQVLRRRPSDLLRISASGSSYSRFSDSRSLTFGQNQPQFVARLLLTRLTNEGTVRLRENV